MHQAYPRDLGRRVRPDDGSPWTGDRTTVRKRNRQRSKFFRCQPVDDERSQRVVQPPPPGRLTGLPAEHLGQPRQPDAVHSHRRQRRRVPRARQSGVHQIRDHIEQHRGEFLGGIGKNMRTFWYEIGSVGSGKPWCGGQSAEDQLT